MKRSYPRCFRRSPQLRWEQANHLAQFAYREAREEVEALDETARAVWSYLRFRHDASRVAHYPVLHEAMMLAEDRERRDLTEGYLLVGADDEEIGEIVGVSSSAVSMFAEVFFDVRPHLSNRHLAMFVFGGPAFLPLESLDDPVYRLIHRVAFFTGRTGLDVWRGIPITDAEFREFISKMRTAFATRIAIMVAGSGLGTEEVGRGHSRLVDAFAKAMIGRPSDRNRREPATSPSQEAEAIAAFMDRSV